MNYDNVLNILLNEFPAFKEFLVKEYIDDVLYLVFSYSVYPYVIKMLENKACQPVLRRLFAFFERMATCNDREVASLLLCSILEKLGDDPHILKKAGSYMGEKTKRLSYEAETHLGRINMNYEEYVQVYF